MKNHSEFILYESFVYIIPLVLISIITAITAGYGLSLIPLACAAFIAFFFRNPERKIPDGKDIIVSPGDGKVVSIENVFSDGQLVDGQLAEELKDKVLKISIFLSLFDVHINRMPCSGEVIDIKGKKGRFLPAFKDAASFENEQVGVKISHNGHKILVRQIAGVIARRIVCWARVGDRFEKGERYGIIRFGSRVDIFLPESIELSVKIGDKVKGGETILGVLR